MIKREVDPACVQIKIVFFTGWLPIKTFLFSCTSYGNNLRLFNSWLDPLWLQYLYSFYNKRYVHDPFFFSILIMSTCCNWNIESFSNLKIDSNAYLFLLASCLNCELHQRHIVLIFRVNWWHPIWPLKFYCHMPELFFLQYSDHIIISKIILP